MAFFERPKNTVMSYEDLAVGQLLWEVFGGWAPSAKSIPVRIIRTAIPYRQHPSYADYSTQGDLLVFEIQHMKKDDEGNYVADTQPNGREYTSLQFCSDHNLMPDYSHNDNYLFYTEEDAKAAVAYLTEQYQANPERIQQEEDRHAFLSSAIDDVFDDYYDCCDYDDYSDLLSDD